MQTIKSILTLTVLLATTLLVSAQNKSEWKEKDDFHVVMSQTFHPAEEGNFNPIRERSGEMVEKAILWQKSAIPADFKEVKSIKKNLKKLVKDSKKLDKKINKNATNEAILTDLVALHDVFHSFVGLCKMTDNSPH